MTGDAPRTFLFLQGPHGSYFARLGGALAARGHLVHRINLCGGDRHDWPGPAAIDAFVSAIEGPRSPAPR